MTFLALASRSARAADDAKAPRLWFDHPAAQWIDGLPIGNGRMGAMIMGGTADERIQFNEDTLWTGKPHDYVRAGAADHLKQIQQLVFEGRSKEAADLVRATFLSDPVRQKAYQPFGDLRFHFPGHDAATDYRRELDLASALANISYRVGEVTYERQVFASYPDRMIVAHLTASQPGHLTFTLKMDSPHKAHAVKAIAPDTLALTGKVQDDGLSFEARLRVIAAGGKTTVNDDGIAVDGADSVTLLLTAATSFKNFQDITADPAQRCEAVLAKVKGKTFDALLANHLADYQKLFGRVSIDLGHTERADLPTDQRVQQVNKSGLDGDPALAALDFQLGRYLLIASSRAGGQPANLQGIWNDQINPPWESKWTTNINLEMNYWPAEVANLTDCTPPLFDLISDLRISGHRTAEEQYHAGGWVLHHNTDLWRGTAPINNIDGVWPTGGAWLCYHLWEHYLFTKDQDFLRRQAYPAMKEASLFFADYLVKDPKTGWLVTNPSFSPEQGTLCAGPSMDNQLIRSLLDNTIEAAGILGVDADVSSKLAEIRRQLPPDQVGKEGQLQEWLDDVDKPNNNHRHMSPLWGLYPGALFTPADPKIWDAAKVLLKWRGDGSTGWSYAWRIPLWARVHDGEFAYRQLGLLLAKRTFPNLFDKCGPFQIDGNFGETAGVAEMLLQSHLTMPETQTRIIDLLPALPRAWPKGSVTGLCARGGFQVDETWDGGKLTKAVIRSKLGEPCRVRYGDESIDLKTVAGQAYTFDGDLHEIR